MKYYLFNQDCEFHLIKNKDIKEVQLSMRHHHWALKPFILYGNLIGGNKPKNNNIKSFSLKEARKYKTFIDNLDYCFKDTPVQIRRRNVN